MYAHKVLHFYAYYIAGTIAQEHPHFSVLKESNISGLCMTIINKVMNAYGARGNMYSLLLLACLLACLLG